MSVSDIIDFPDMMMGTKLKQQRNTKTAFLYFPDDGGQVDTAKKYKNVFVFLCCFNLVPNLVPKVF